MFYKSEFNGDISGGDVSNVTNMGGLFTHSKFRGDISNWNVGNVRNMNDMFLFSPLYGREPWWYIGDQFINMKSILILKGNYMEEEIELCPSRSR